VSVGGAVADGTFLLNPFSALFSFWRMHARIWLDVCSGKERLTSSKNQTQTE